MMKKPIGNICLPYVLRSIWRNVEATLWRAIVCILLHVRGPSLYIIRYKNQKKKKNAAFDLWRYHAEEVSG